MPCHNTPLNEDGYVNKNVKRSSKGTLLQNSNERVQDIGSMVDAPSENILTNTQACTWVLVNFNLSLFLLSIKITE